MGDVALRVRPEQAAELGEAARVLGSMSPGRVGDELALTVRRARRLAGADAARASSACSTTRGSGASSSRSDGRASAVRRRQPTAAPRLRSPTRGTLSWRRCRATGRSALPPRDRLERRPPRTALLCAPVNPTTVEARARVHLPLRGRAGYGVSPAMARRCFERLDAEGLPGRVEVLRLLSRRTTSAPRAPPGSSAARCSRARADSPSSGVPSAPGLGRSSACPSSDDLSTSSCRRCRRAARRASPVAQPAHSTVVGADEATPWSPCASPAPAILSDAALGPSDHERDRPVPRRAGPQVAVTGLPRRWSWRGGAAGRGRGASSVERPFMSTGARSQMSGATRRRGQRRTACLDVLGRVADVHVCPWPGQMEAVLTRYCPRSESRRARPRGGRRPCADRLTASVERDSA